MEEELKRLQDEIKKEKQAHYITKLKLSKADEAYNKLDDECKELRKLRQNDSAIIRKLQSKLEEFLSQGFFSRLLWALGLRSL